MNTDQQKQFFTKTFTLQGRVFFPNLITPYISDEDKAAGKKAKFKGMFAWPKNSNGNVMPELGQFLAQAKQLIHPTVPEQFYVNPIKDHDTYQRQDGKPNHEFTQGCYWVNASTLFQPVVVGPSKEVVMNEAEVYSGRNCLFNISFYNIDGQKKGIGVNIQAVMLLEGGAQQGAGGVQVDPNQVFGSFQVDSGLINQGGQAPALGAANNPFAAQTQAATQQVPAQVAPAHSPMAQPMQQPVQQPVAPQVNVAATPQVQQPVAPQQGQTAIPNYNPNNNNPFGV